MQGDTSRQPSLVQSNSSLTFGTFQTQRLAGLKLFLFNWNTQVWGSFGGWGGIETCVAFLPNGQQNGPEFSVGGKQRSKLWNLYSNPASRRNRPMPMTQRDATCGVGGKEWVVEGVIERALRRNTGARLVQVWNKTWLLHKSLPLWEQHGQRAQMSFLHTYCRVSFAQAKKCFNTTKKYLTFAGSKYNRHK